jgi:hypothetical protein
LFAENQMPAGLANWHQNKSHAAEIFKGLVHQLCIAGVIGLLLVIGN